MIKQREYSVIARSYAHALFRSAQKQNMLQRVNEEAGALVTALEKTPRLTVFLGNPQASTEQKLELLDKVLRGRISPVVMRMITMLVTRDRTIHLEQILALFRELVEEAEGIQKASVQTAMELGFQEKLKLKAALEKYTGSRLRLEYDVEPDLIGGLIFRFKDLLIDSSVRSGLVEIRRRMLATGVVR